MLNNFFELGLTNSQLENYAVKLGADCAFFIRNKPTFATGIGNKFHSINLDLSEYQIIIFKPDVQVNTKDAYQNIIPRKPTFSLPDLINNPVSEWKNHVINDFENSVFSTFPQLAKLKELIYGLGAEYVSMTGSGSALYGIFRNLPADFDKKIPTGILIYR